MHRRDGPQSIGRDTVNDWLVHLAATHGHFPISEDTTRISQDVYDNRRPTIENGDGGMLRLHVRTEDELLVEPANDTDGWARPMTAVHDISALEDCAHELLPAPINPPDWTSSIRNFTVQTYHTAHRSPLTRPIITIEFHPNSSDKDIPEPVEPRTWRPTNALYDESQVTTFDAPPEITDIPTSYPSKASVRQRSRLQVNTLLVALADAYGEFPVRELIWELPKASYTQFRQRYDAGGSGGAGVWATNDQGQVLLVQHNGEDTWSEPGGKREPGETFREAAIREFTEETGVTPSITGVQEVDAILHTDQQGERASIVSPIVVFQGTAAGTPSGRQGEIAAAEWWDHRPDNLLYPALEEFPIPAAD